MTGHQQARVKGTAEPISRRGWARENIDGLHRFHLDAIVRFARAEKKVDDT